MQTDKKSFPILNWIILALLSLGSLAFAAKYFSAALPLVDVELRMDRGQALKKAANIAAELHIEPAVAKEVAYFSTDYQLQSFIELQPDGKEHFKQLMREGLISPYQWLVRHFSEGEAHEALFYFKPDGTPYGFKVVLPESEKGEDLAEAAARLIAEKAASNYWHLDLSDYEPVEYASELQVGGRRDHSFVYQRKGLKINDAPLRVKLGVSGDKFTSLSPYVEIPEAFERQFNEMRSANKYIGFAGSAAYLSLYLFGGCVIGLALLYRKKWLLWKPALMLAAVVAVLGLMAQLSAFPQTLIMYDTALPATTFIFQQLLNIVFATLGMLAFAFIALMAAEGLTRLAFGNHIQLWKIFSPQAVASPEIMGRVLGGYMAACFHLGYMVAFGYVAYRYLGWWSPASTVFEPNILAYAVPWITPVAQAFQAGVVEECLFRAVPLSLAALIGQRFGKRSLFIGIAFVVQALIFGAMHANYPVQPGYARVVELVIPSFVFGWLYLSYGLIPGIISHVMYDLVLMSAPIFVEQGSSSLPGKIAIIIMGLIPLFIVVIGRLRAGAFTELSEKFKNKSFAPKESFEQVNEPDFIPSRVISKRTVLAFVFFGALGFLAWIFAENTSLQSSRVSINPKQAQDIALAYLGEQKLDLKDYTVLSSFDANPAVADLYVWQQDGAEKYQQLMGNFLNGPHYLVRLAKFSGDLQTREEEYQLGVDGGGKVIWYKHQIPQAAALVSVDEGAARSIAMHYLQEHNFDSAQLKELSAAKVALPHRQEWNFVFSDHNEGAYLGHKGARVSLVVAGDKVQTFGLSVHTLEEWTREHKAQTGLISSLNVICVAFVMAIFVMGAIRSIVLWSRGRFSKKSFAVAFVGLIVLLGLRFFNAQPAMIFAFNSYESFNSQLIVLYSMSIIQIVVMALGLAFIFGAARIDCQAAKLGPPFAKTVIGLSFGFLFSGVLILIIQFLEPSYPKWGDFSALSTSYPFLQSAIFSCLRLVIESSSLVLISLFANAFSHHFQKRKILTNVFFIIFGIALIGSRGITDLAHWLVPGVVYGALLGVAYTRLFRFDVSLVPLVVLPSVVLSLVGDGIRQAYAGSALHILFGIIAVLALATVWYGSWQRVQEN